MQKHPKWISEETDNNPSVEDILTYVRGMRNYPGGVEATSLTKTTIDELERRICEEIRLCVNKELPNMSSSYHKLAAWIGSIPRDFPIEIFTTNYDLLIEQALEDVRVPFFDGFVGSMHPFFDPYAIDFDQIPPRWARVWKIHGSINWRRNTEGQTLKIWRVDSREGDEVVIHPSHLKYDESRRMPYLALMDHLRNFLSTSYCALIIIGYSFRDQHLNDVIIQALQGSPSSAAFALMHSTLENYPAAKELAKGRGNLSVLAKDAAVIGTSAAKWDVAHDKPDSKLSTSAVDWTERSDEDSVWDAALNLGNFQVFTEFLLEISGRGGLGDTQH